MQPIQQQLERRLVDSFFETARRGPLDKALTEFGSFVTGQPGFVTFGGHAMIAIDSDAPFIGPDGPLEGSAWHSVSDPVLEEVGLAWTRVDDPTPAGYRAIVGALLLRAGLLCRMLDEAYAHLETRESGGKRILQHQLVKACFVESFGVAEQLREEGVSLLDESLDIDLIGLHRRLSIATMKASKLMGGHGFLVGSVNTLELLSMCIAGHAAQNSVAMEELRAGQVPEPIIPFKELLSCPT